MVSAKEKTSYPEHQVHEIQGNNLWTPQAGVGQDLIAAHRANLQNTCAGKDLQLTELTRSWLLVRVVFRHPQHVLLQAVSGRWHWGIEVLCRKDSCLPVQMLTVAHTGPRGLEQMEAGENRSPVTCPGPQTHSCVQGGVAEASLWDLPMGQLCWPFCGEQGKHRWTWS